MRVRAEGGNPWPAFAWPAALAGVSAAGYLLAARWLGFTGFPLDDAWIHQTFGRNLAQLGQWAFVPGQPSAGSTSVLWTLAVALGYALGLEGRAWTYLCGWVALALTAWLAGRVAARLGGGRTGRVLAACLAAAEWHMAWASVSGMETLLFAALALLAFDRLLAASSSPNSDRPWAEAGVAAGLAILARPDGLTLLPFAFVAVGLAWPGAGSKRTLRRAVALAAPAGLLLAAYLAFNYSLSGQVWPNTFYAKQAEYAVLRQAGLIQRLASVGLLPFVGALSILLPGIGLAVSDAYRQRRWEAMLPLAWALSFLALYAWRLPVDYQHGRYVMPVIPALAAVGAAGAGRWLKMAASGFARRVISRAWALSLAAVTLAFWLRGAQAYSQDVAFIETEMVAAARWLGETTRPDEMIAAHDIGAIGYFARRPILDLAGLVSPEVIPILRDEPALARLILDSGARYLVTFPGWYPALTADPHFELTYSTGGGFSQAPGGENMAVYRVHSGFLAGG